MSTLSSPAASDLRPVAQRAMRNAGFDPDFSAAELKEAESARESAGDNDAAIRDARSLLWSSIDNVESRDLDQVEFAEKLDGDVIRLLIGIADVDAFVPRASTLDAHAGKNTTSVYTGVETFPMLPRTLSEDATSLLPDEDRLAVVVALLIAPDGSVSTEEVFRARLTNRAKLDYESVGAWLEDASTPLPESVGNVAGLEAQLKLQDEAATRLKTARAAFGALSFQTVEARPVVQNGRVTNIALTSRNRARDLIESFMVASNSAIAEFLRVRNSLSIGRIVREPARWNRIVEIAKNLGEDLPQNPDSRALSQFLERRKNADAAHFADLSLSIVKLLGPGEYSVEAPGETREGHFGLAVRDYTHSTAPNRRYVDLVTQRLLKACIAPISISASTPYSESELETIAAHCTERENASNKVERLMRKIAAASLLSQRIGETFDAIVTGASPKGTYVRLISPPVEGRVMRGERGLDVGEKTKVRLISTDAQRGFIDFEHVG